ncbi:MAG: iron ABC transporter permease [Coriobacteriales bacterium]|nr:iron ABC transporter permease [Coriobacteriales bacterium]
MLLLAAVASLCLGQYQLDMPTCIRILISKIIPLQPDWTPVEEKVVLYLRLPRIIAVMLVGAALSMAGSAYQGVFQNPLVSSDLLGVSSGACVGAAIAILSGFGAFGKQTLAFLMGIGTVAITVLIPKLLRNKSNIMLVLSGVIVGGLMGSIMGFIKYVADPETELAEITYWQMGSFAYVKFGEIASVLPFMIISMIGLFILSWKIDLLSLGETEARTLGLNVVLMRDLTILFATLLTASSVCLSGTIGWISLVIPHFARMFVGPNNQRLLPSAALLGAIFLLVVGTCSRTITTTELPISVLTGIIGAPFYVLLLYRQKTRLQQT